jgi:hypothetical protein
MKSQISFIKKHECLNAANKLRLWAKMGGFETVVYNKETVNSEEESYDYTVSSEQCEHAADQFEAYAEKDGEYYCNIIQYPHFSSSERDAILNIV